MTKHHNRKQALKETRLHRRVRGSLRMLRRVLFGLVILVIAFIGLYLNYLNSPKHFAEVDMTRTAFTQSSIYADTGAQVHFVDPTDGAVQVLCLGSNGRCSDNPQGPAEISGSAGLRVEPGQTITMTFYWAGTFQITSATTPGMNMTIYVRAKQ